MKRFHEFKLDNVNECLWQGSARLSLTPKALAVLNCLVESAGSIVTKDEFMEQVWPGIYVGEENLKVYIRELRALLGDGANNPKFIETYRDKGYRFIAPVTEELLADDLEGAQLFGREIELAKLHESLKQACAGNRQIVFISGEPGIGKTSLVETFLRLANQPKSFRIGFGQCIETYSEQEAFYPVLEAFGRILSDPKGPEFADLLAWKAPTWFVQFPGIASRVSTEQMSTEILGAGRERMLREICEALDVLTANTPLVIVFEDLHWSDRSTLDFIAALARRREPARLLLIATYRPVELILSNHPLRSLKPELCLHGHASELSLELLDKTAVSNYLNVRFSGAVSEGVAADLHRKTDGNPLFLFSLIDHLIDQKMIVEVDGEWLLDFTAEQLQTIVPNNLNEVIQSQVDQLEPQEQELLTAASVIGQSFSTTVLANSLASDISTVDTWCDSLSRRHLFLTRGGLLDLPTGEASGLFQFTHALYRDSIYHKCRPTARLQSHRRVGETIEKIWQGHENEVAAELARHFEESRDHERVIQYLRLLAQNAEHRYAYQDAIILLERATEFASKLSASSRSSKEVELWSQLARIYDKLADKPNAAKLFAAVTEQAAALNDWVVAADSLISQSRQLAYSDPPLALKLAERALQIGSSNSEGKYRLRAEAWTAFLQLCWSGWDPQIEEILERRVAQLREVGDRGIMAQEAVGLASIQVFTGNYEKALRTSAEILPALAVSGDALSHFSARWMRSLALMKLGRLGESLEGFQESLALADRNMNPFDSAYAQLFLAELHCESFSPQTATQLCKDALSRLAGSSIAMQRGFIISAIANLESGNLDRAGDYLSQTRALYEKSNVLVSWYWKLLLHEASSESSLAAGDVVSARAESNQLRELADALPNQMFRARATRISAKVALAESNAGLAEVEIAHALGIVDNHDIPLAAWRVHETAAAVCQATKNRDAVKRHSGMRDEILSKLALSLPASEPLHASIIERLNKSIETTSASIS